MKNYIGLNIKYLCDRNFLSQKDFGNIFGLTQAVVNAYIKEKSNPQVETIQKICKHFELSIDDFLNLDLSTKSYDNKTQAALSTGEPQPVNYSDKDKIIQAQAKTIETLEKHTATLERLVENLEAKLGNVS